jgi:hypothetical protein
LAAPLPDGDRLPEGFGPPEPLMNYSCKLRNDLFMNARISKPARDSFNPFLPKNEPNDLIRHLSLRHMPAAQA